MWVQSFRVGAVEQTLQASHGDAAGSQGSGAVTESMAVPRSLRGLAPEDVTRHPRTLLRASGLVLPLDLWSKNRFVRFP